MATVQFSFPKSDEKSLAWVRDSAPYGTLLLRTNSRGPSIKQRRLLIKAKSNGSEAHDYLVCLETGDTTPLSNSGILYAQEKDEVFRPLTPAETVTLSNPT